MAQTDGLKNEGAEADEATAERRYEPPTIAHIGNVRDLLGGASGTHPDGSPPAGPIIPSQTG